MRLFLFSFILCGNSAGAAPAETNPPEAGQSYFARTWQTDDGLPRNTITAITQTPDGYLWLGTPEGIIRFDGVRFTPMEAGDSKCFVRALPRVLLADRRGRLWIGTGTAGIIRFDGENFTVLDSRKGLPHPTVTALCEDFHGTIWVACQNGSLAWVDAADTVHPVAPPPGETADAAPQLVRDARGRLWFALKDTYGQLLDGVATNVTGVPDAGVRLCPSRDGGLWVTTGTELRKLPPPASTNAMDTVTLPLRRYQVDCLLEDRWGNLWVGTAGQGLLRYANHKFVREWDSSRRILSLFEDSEAGLWVGTQGGGLTRLWPKIFHTVNVRKGRPNSTLLSICQDSDGAMWLCSQGPGLTRLDADGRTTDFNAFTDIGTTCVLPKPAGGVWVGTVNHGLFSVQDGKASQRTELNALRNRQIRSLHQDARGRLWIGCLPDGLARLAAGESTSPFQFFYQGGPPSAIWAIADDRDGRLWLGTIIGELWSYDGHHFTGHGPADGLPGAPIGALLAATNGDLWIGTLGGGLGRLRQGRFVFADTQNGLADNVICSIVDDSMGNFWLGTERGICRMKQRDLEDFADRKRNHFDCICYGKDEGLQSVECLGGYQPAAWRAADGKIWFATSKGAVVVDPAALPVNPVPPPLVLEKIQLDDAPLTNHARIKIAYGYRSLEFEYSAPSFSSPARIRFRHQLVGLDPDWVDAGTARTVAYPRLAPGRYVFRFTACNPSGVWNENPVAVAFQVTPAYWQTTWFRVLALLAFAGLVGSGVRQRYKQKMKRKLVALEQAHAIEQERMRIARDIHDDLGARLTQVALLSEMSAGEIGPGTPAGERLGKIAAGSRQAIRSLEEIVWAVNPRKDSLPDFFDFLSHYANEFFRATPIRCRQDLPLVIPEIPLSAEMRHHLFLACKETLNNIQKHSQATEVWLRMNLNGADLQVTIEDNGRGFPAPARTAAGNGLLNLQNRLAIIGGQCRVDSQAGRGTCVRFSLKLPDNFQEKPAPSSPPQT